MLITFQLSWTYKIVLVFFIFIYLLWSIFSQTKEMGCTRVQCTSPFYILISLYYTNVYILKVYLRNDWASWAKRYAVESIKMFNHFYYHDGVNRKRGELVYLLACISLEWSGICTIMSLTKRKVSFKYELFYRYLFHDYNSYLTIILQIKLILLNILSYYFTIFREREV